MAKTALAHSVTGLYRLMKFARPFGVASRDCAFARAVLVIFIFQFTLGTEIARALQTH